MIKLAGYTFTLSIRSVSSSQVEMTFFRKFCNSSRHVGTQTLAREAESRCSPSGAQSLGGIMSGFRWWLLFGELDCSRDWRDSQVRRRGKSLIAGYMGVVDVDAGLAET